MTRAPISPAISAVRSLLESTTRTSAPGTTPRMSAITLPTAFSSLRVIIATVRFSRLSSVDMRGPVLLDGLGAHDNDPEGEHRPPQRRDGVLDGVEVLHVELVRPGIDDRPRVGRSVLAVRLPLQQRQQCPHQ